MAERTTNPISKALVALTGCLVIAGCPNRAPSSSTRPTSSARLVVIDPPDAGAELESNAALPSNRDGSPPTASGPEPNTQIADWGIELWVPERAQAEHDGDRHRITVSSELIVSLAVLRTAAPTFDEVRKTWSSGVANRSFGEGTTPFGVMYAIRSYTARIGVRSGTPGRHLHRLQEVTRVYAILPIDPTTHVSCTGYLDHEIEGAEDPSIQPARDICMSLRKLAR